MILDKNLGQEYCGTKLNMHGNSETKHCSYIMEVILFLQQNINQIVNETIEEIFWAQNIFQSHFPQY